MNTTSIYELLASRYPQLLLPIREGMRGTEEYKNAVLRGVPLTGSPDFRGSALDRFLTVPTPAGGAECLIVGNRDDFEHAYQALGFKCEPRPILPSVGAVTLIGLYNWDKIRTHQSEYLAGGGEDWNAEFRRFTSDRKNFTDTLILLSAGLYSNVPASVPGLEEEEWLLRSCDIRLYHELTHFVCRGLYPDRVDVIRDEVLADCMGLLYAFGSYDTALALRFLGITAEGLLPGGRLENYTAEEERPAAVERVRALTKETAELVKDYAAGDDLFELLLRIF